LVINKGNPTIMTSTNLTTGNTANSNQLKRVQALGLWGMVALMLVLTFLLVRGFAHDLPYHFHVDEPPLIVNANELVTAGEIMHGRAYARLFIFQLAGQRLLLDAMQGGQSAGDSIYFFFGRVASVAYALLALAIGYQLGRRLSPNNHGRWAGVVLALLPASMGSYLSLHSIAKADAISFFLMLLTLYLSLRAWHKHSWRMLAGAVVVAILATLAKYNYAPVVGLPVLVALIMAWGRPWVRWVLALGVLGAVLGVLAVAFVPPLQLAFNTYMALAWGDNWAQLPSADNLTRFTLDVWGWLGIVLAVFGLAHALYVGWMTRRKTTLVAPLQTGTQAWQMLLLVAFFTLVVFVFYASTDRPRPRFFVMLYSLFGILVAYGLLQVIRYTHWISAPLIIAFLLAPHITSMVEVVENRYRDDVRAIVGDWLVANVQEPLDIVVEDDPLVVNPQFGGIPFAYPIDSLQVDSFYEQTLGEYRARGMDYLLANSNQVDLAGYLSDTPRPDDFANETEEVFRAEANGQTMVLLRILPPVRDINTDAPENITPLNVEFGDAMTGDVVALYGYDVTLDGAQLLVQLVWEGRASDADYIYFLHLVDTSTEQAVKQIDQMPLAYNMSTSLMEAGEIVVDPVRFDVSDLQSGCYRLLLGWYTPDTFARVPVETDNGDFADVYSLTQSVSINSDGNVNLGECE
jgi:hypothetical protein